MKRSKVLLSIILVLSILAVSVLPVLAESVTALDESTATTRDSKINDELNDILNSSSDESIITVSVWFCMPEKFIFRSSLKNTNSKYGNMSNNRIIIDDLSQLKDDSFKSVSDYQSFSHVFRESRRNVFECYNIAMLNRLIDDYNINPTIIYASLYTPSIILSITKTDLTKIQYEKNIEEIYYHHAEEDTVEDNSEKEAVSTGATEQGNRFVSPYGYWQHSTNIDLLGSVTGATGAGIIVGLYENGRPDGSLPVFENAVSNNRFTYLCNNISNHASLVAAVLTGQTSDYYGVAPKINLVCTNFQTSLENTIENLITHDVNIINISMKISTTQTYDDNAKFLDSIVSDYGVTICKSAGNTASDIFGASLAYNIISVGNINDHNSSVIQDYTIDSSSSYSSGNSAFKPDLSAPGKNNRNPVNPYLSNGGTSCATPVVSGAAALLMQLDQTLLYRPMKLKSALMASANHLPHMIDTYSYASSIEPAIDRQYGSGMIDAYAAYQLLQNNHYLSVSTQSSMSSTTNSLELVVRNRDITNDKSIFATVNWMQEITCYGELPHYSGYYVLPTYHHELRLYDPQGTLIARSTYTYDRKQYIRYKPTVTGTYTLSVYKSGIPTYYPQSAIAYSIYRPIT